MRVNLKQMPDGFGLIYGEGVDSHGELRRINIMPQLPDWRGDIKLEKNGPHATDWVLYVDGEETARSLTWAEIDAALETFLDGEHEMLEEQIRVYRFGPFDMVREKSERGTRFYTFSVCQLRLCTLRW